MINTNHILQRLIQYFRIHSFGEDAAFSQYLPTAYDAIGFNWRDYFEKDFCKYFNGLMIKGNNNITRIFCSTFLSNQVLYKFIERANSDSLLIVHHPIDMRCGNPKGEWGVGFVAPDIRLLKKIKEMGASIISCHLPLDVHETISTSRAIAQGLGAVVVDYFGYEEYGCSGLICDIGDISTDKMICTLKEIFSIPYVDFEGKIHKTANRIAIMAGGGDWVKYMKEAEEKGSLLYISGEVHHHIDNEYGRLRYSEMMEYTKKTSMSLIGVSHAASEFLVFKNQFSDWIKKEFGIEHYLIEEDNWWR